MVYDSTVISRVFQLAVTAASLLASFPSSAAPVAVETDICVYGGTSGGVAAAVAAARLGKSVALVHYNNHLGGMSSGGLGVTDVGQQGAIGGISREFYQRVGQRYNMNVPVYWFEPMVAESVFWQMAGEAGVNVFTNERIAGVAMNGQRITELVTESGMRFRAKMFIDTTYEGDVIAAAGVSFTVGREGTNTYAESLAGVRAPSGSYSYDPYVTPGNTGSGLLPLMQPNTLGAIGSGDHRIQAYNFRLCLTQNSTNRISLTSNAPLGYLESNYELAARYLEARLASDGAVSLGQLIHLQTIIPNGKTDINANGELSTDYVGESYTWATNSHAARELIRQKHENYIRGLLYFFGTNTRVPANVRTEMQAWGLAKDEFTDTAGWPHQIYVREARRMVSDYVMRQQNCLGTQFATEPIGLASYQMDSHSLARVPSGGLARSEGGLFAAVSQPFPISYRSIIPRTGQCENVFSTFALSASHVAFASCRMEPVFMITSQSAATAAAFAIDDNVSVQQVNYAKVAVQLRADGQLLDWVGGTVATNGIIMDNGQPGASQSGSWTTGFNTVFWGINYFHDQNSGKGSKYVRYTPNLPTNGTYDVFTWYVSHPNRATNAPHDVVHANGTNRVLVNQTLNGSQWVFLMRTNFTSGAGHGVIIRTDGTFRDSLNGYVIADAVRFAPTNPPVVPPPTVEIVASDPRADERGTNRARFTLVRDGSLSNALSVNYALGGTASNGVDYAALSGSVVIPAGSNSVALLIAPVVDGAAEDDETVSVTLQTAAGYQIGALNTATALIRDADTLPSQLRSIGTIDGNFIIEFDAATNRSYALQSSISLTPTAWSNTTMIPADGSARTVRLTNSMPANLPTRFFRLVTP